jgi:hypothetical protein
MGQLFGCTIAIEHSNVCHSICTGTIDIVMAVTDHDHVMRWRSFNGKDVPQQVALFHVRAV